MNEMTPRVSVVIPSNNRRVLLRKLLDGLALQTYPLSLIELIVVADGCNDGTSEMIRCSQLPFVLRLVEQQRLGAAAARNRGAAASSGKLLVFLDDDVLPTTCFIEAHVRAHRKSTPQVAVGYSPLVFEGPGDFFRLGMRSWWESEYSAMRRPGYRYTYRSLFSGNFSIETELFNRMGGFNETLPRHEDYEFGLRLLNANILFIFVPDAIGYHHDISDLHGSLRRAYQEGRGDVRIGFLHPKLRRTIKLAQLAEPRTFFYRMVSILAFNHRKTGDALAFILRQALRAVERLQIRWLWRKIYIGIRAYWYLCGAAEELGRHAQLRCFLQGTPPGNDAGRCEIDIDLGEGILLAEQKLDQERPDSVRIRYMQQIVGRIPVQEGAERLTGRHLRDFLANSVSRPLIEQLSLRTTSETLNPQTVQTVTRFDGVRTQFEQRMRPDMRTKVIDIELSGNLGAVSETNGYDALHILARYYGRPIGWVSVGNSPFQSVVSRDRLQEAFTEKVGRSLALAVLHKQVDSTFNDKRSLEPISVVICTRDRTDQLAACLEAVQAQDYPTYEIIIVDNAPSNNDTSRLVRGLPIRYVREPRPGLNWARNRGIADARHSIIAFTDDDVRPDRYWLRGIGQAFTEPGVMAVTGLIAPAELETNAQHLFEFAYGGMGKGFQRRTFRVDGMSTRDLLWANAFGVGANMSFRRELFSLIGGFDVALDRGTPAGGAGDLDMFHRLVAKGCTLVYDPSVLVWHVHRRSNKLLQQQLYDNGRSFGTYLLTCIRNRTVSPIAVLGFIAREWLGRRLIGLLLRPRGLPRRLILMEIIGALRSPLAYRAAQARAREVAEIFDRRKTLPQAEVAYAEGERSVSDRLSDVKT